MTPCAIWMSRCGWRLVLRDADEWFDFRERTWRDYWDFAPLAKEALLDLLSPAP